MSEYQQSHNPKYRNQNSKSHNSFDAINSAFNKTPRWRQKEKAAQKRRRQKTTKINRFC